MGEKLVVARYGEIHLKGGNRAFFVRALVRNLKNKVGDTATVDFQEGRVFVVPKQKNICEADLQRVLGLVLETFGITSASVVTKVDATEQAILAHLESVEVNGSFKVNVNRANKTFPIKSMDFAARCGEVIYKANKNAKREVSVDVVNPGVVVNVDIRDKAYIFDILHQGLGGLPVGVSGKAVCLLSGGIDSPVAAFLAAKRGLSIDFVHFATPPYTNDLALEKVKNLQSAVERFVGKTNLYVVPFTEISRAIKKNCADEFVITLMRRFMVRIAEQIGVEHRADCIITGENLAQVASQTIQGITSNNFCANVLPILRPLVTYDKQEIIALAKKIGTYLISIQPHPDCCTVFVPSNPSIKPILKKVEIEEGKLDVDSLVKSALVQI